MTDIDRLTAALAGRYAILREAGTGGMATVFLAQDLKHDRQVAIKVMRPELATAIGAERFLREVAITAKLNHPHILPLLDSGEAGGLLYYIMPFVEGETLHERIAREGQLPIEDALEIARSVAAALSYAHSQDIVHRDIKPDNVLLSAGVAVVADFGIAKAVSEASGGGLTQTGISVGTPAYMSPEQASGDDRVDRRTDIYALGCVLYEMLSGDAPYTASTPQALLVRKLNEPLPRISVVRETVPPGVEAALTKALAKVPADRYATAEQFADALTTAGSGIAAPTIPGAADQPARRSEAAAAFELRGLARRLRRPWVAIPVAVAIVAVAYLAVWFTQRRERVQWARQEVIPEIERLIGENDVWRNLVAPYRLAEQAEAILGDDPELAALSSRISLEIDVRTDPPGASIYMKEYGDAEGEWTQLGVSPLERVRAPIGIFRWRIEKEGYETVHAAASTWDIGGGADIVSAFELVRKLDEVGTVPSGMVRVPATETPVGTLADFFIDRYEVTNQEYKEFIDAGGYRSREYWKHPFVKDGRQLSWETAMREFVDRSDQPGPATWLGGDYPQGQGEHPVSGVSWYEAAAYAEYVGKSLPTSAHWDVARGAFTPMIRWPELGGFAVLAPFSNFGGQGPVPVGSLQGLTPYGAHDMAGNVREWCWNETQQGRLIRGGAWEDNTYEFGNRRQAPAMDRSPRNGFRLAVYPEPEAVPAAAFELERLGVPRDFRVPPVSDAVFAAYREQFSYDETELNARVEQREERPGGWTWEEISFDAAYGGERVIAHLYLPTNTSPPFQTVIYFPGSASTWMASSENLESYYEFSMFLSFLVRNGRAVLYPVYKGTFERGDPSLAALHPGAESYRYSEFLGQLVKDFRRSVDYLETRPDVDSEQLAYYGMSWGGTLGAVIPAVEERLGASVLVAGGLRSARTRPEALDLNYVTRVRTPTLMLNGRYDNIFDVEEQVKRMFDLLGTPAEHKRLILYETDHIPPRTEYIKEILAWLDTYLGPVGGTASTVSP